MACRAAARSARQLLQRGADEDAHALIRGTDARGGGGRGLGGGAGVPIGVGHELDSSMRTARGGPVRRRPCAHYSTGPRAAYHSASCQMPGLTAPASTPMAA